MKAFSLFRILFFIHSIMVRAIWTASVTPPPAIPVYEPELPLRAGVLPLPEGLTMPGCIRDAAPDAWGRRVILNKKFGHKGAGTDTAEIDELTYLLESPLRSKCSIFYWQNLTGQNNAPGKLPAPLA